MLTCEHKFQELYHKEAEGISFCPYRICPIGAHSDHNLGKITGLAIDKGVCTVSDLRDEMPQNPHHRRVDSSLQSNLNL